MYQLYQNSDPIPARKAGIKYRFKAFKGTTEYLEVFALSITLRTSSVINIKFFDMTTDTADDRIRDTGDLIPEVYPTRCTRQPAQRIHFLVIRLQLNKEVTREIRNDLS